MIEPQRLAIQMVVDAPRRADDQARLMHPQLVELLEHGIAADQQNGAELLVHSLKGSAALIGATPVAELATALLSALRQHSGREEIELHYAALAPALQTLIAGLQQAREAVQAV